MNLTSMITPSDSAHHQSSPEWLTLMTNSATQPNPSVGELSKFITALLTHVESCQGDYASFNESLSLIKTSTTHIYHLVATLRTLFRMRHSLSQWPALRNQVVELLQTNDLSHHGPIHVIMDGLMGDLADHTGSQVDS